MTKINEAAWHCGLVGTKWQNFSKDVSTQFYDGSPSRLQCEKYWFAEAWIFVPYRLVDLEFIELDFDGGGEYSL